MVQMLVRCAAIMVAAASLLPRALGDDAREVGTLATTNGTSTGDEECPGLAGPVYASCPELPAECGVARTRRRIENTLDEYWNATCDNDVTATGCGTDEQQKLPTAARLLLTLLQAEESLCQCMGGVVTSSATAGAVSCSKNLSCYLQPGACFNELPVEAAPNGSAAMSCAKKMNCAKHVSQARGLFLEAAYKHGIAKDCIGWWQKCVFKIVTCEDHVCPTQHVSPECPAEEYCMFAAAGVGVVAPPSLLALLALAAAQAVFLAG